MATETNKNVTYPNYNDLYRRQRINTNASIKTSLSQKISTFVDAVKQKHM